MRSALRPAWMEQGACLDVDPELFHPASQLPEAAEPAKRICGRCPVKSDCLAHAMETGQGEGVWGGLDDRERRSLRRRQARADAKAEQGLVHV